MRFNEEQLEAINTIGTNILVSASAGAGKTSVLVQRLLKRCLEDKVSLNKIVALTFTDAAAAEMKKRLSSNLNKLYQDENSDKAYIKQQLVYLTDADITTIDAYCLKIVKKYYYAIGLDPKLADNILDDSILNNIKEQAFHDGLNIMLEKYPEDTTTLLKHFSSRPEDISSLFNTTIAIINSANSTSDSKKFLDKILNDSKIIRTLNDLNPTILNGFFEYLFNQLTMIEDNLMILSSSLGLQEEDEKYLNSINLKLEYLPQLYEYLNNHNYDTFNMQFKNFSTKAIQLPRKEFKYEKDIKKKIVDREKKLLEILYSSETFIKNHNDLTNIYNTLINLVIITMENIKVLKTDIQGMDFEDMEHYALNILKANDNLIAKQLQNTYEEIMVDEFQDTNEIQNDIINLISNGHNAFRVGDVKQSIYRFRKAKPSLMRDLSHDENTKQINLSYNYRSKENIVEFNNCLYDVCMNIPGLEDTYKSQDNVKVGVDAQKETLDDSINFYTLKSQEGINNKVLKADFIARKILTLKNQDPTSKYKDYVVLLRTHDDKKYLKDAFEKYHLPYNVDAKDNFYASLLCLMILSYLKLIIHINNQDLISVLKNFYDMNSDDLAIISKQDIYTYLQDTNHPLINDLNNLKDIYNNKGLIELLNALCNIQDFYENRLNNKEKTNFDQLFNIALNFNKQANSLAKFIYEIENGSETKTKEVTSISLDEDVIRAITIHQSKGLQYKTVFIWSTSQSRNNELKNEHLIDTDLGLALKPLELPKRIRQTTIEYLVINEKLNKEELEENTRLLYVATTRAQNRMYFVDVVDEIKDTKMNYETLCERKGISGTILSSISDNPYINIKEDDVKKISFETPKSKTNTLQTIKHYHSIDINTFKVISPSNTHESTLLTIKPTLNRFSRGTTIHNILEELPIRKWTMDDLKPYNLNPNDINHLLVFNNSSLFAQTENYQVYKEYPFIYKDNTQVINGTMDLLMINDSEIIIVDYKTNRNTTKEELINLYSPQLDIYAKVMHESYPNHKISKYIYAFELDEAIIL